MNYETWMQMRSGGYPTKPTLQLDRRDLLRLVAGIGLGAAGFGAVSSGGRAMQESSPAADAAMPPPGERADGTYLWRVKVGGMDMANSLDLQAFFPGEITINVGDSIWFEFGQMPGFHTVTFLSGNEPMPLLIPDPEEATPAAGAQPRMVLNPGLLFPSGGDQYDGTGIVHSGADIFADPTKPVVLTFTAPGTFDYLCLPHAAVMSAKVIVQEAGSARPYDQAAVDQLAAEQMAALIDEGIAEIAANAEAIATARDDGTALWEMAVGAGPGQVRVMGFLPKELTIAVGDTVRWVNRSTGEPHTVTFVGEGATPPEDTIVEQFADGSPKLIQNMATFLPAGGPIFDGTGYVNSGFMGIFGLPETFELTFSAVGEFLYYCALHGDAAGNGMAAKLIVTER